MQRFEPKNPASLVLRMHCQTSGVSLTEQDPYNNIVRTAVEALAAVLGGTQSLHTNALDETLALPTETAVRVALRTQQILAYETGVPNTSDPLGGSYLIEALTDQLEAQAEGIFAHVESLGGVVPAIEAGWFQREIAQSASRFQTEVETGQKTVVGLNAFVEETEAPIEILKIDEGAERVQRERMARMRARRNAALVTERLAALEAAARSNRNIIPAMLDCARAYCTLYEIRHVLQDVWGAYREPVFF